ncbi:MAG TPA: DNA-processing protein DprA [Rhodoglobus sp.]|nr:DNA-processing protein DprA [Rhodoglobus sp.]
MSLFGLREAEVAQLIRGVSDDDPDRDAVADRFARVAWSCLTEPGDRVAGELVQTVGVTSALEGMIQRWDAQRFAAAARGMEVDELAAGIARWTPRFKAADVLLALRQAARFGARLRTAADDGWPAGLSDLGEHAPFVLWTRGTDAALAALDRSIALVGARAATGYGEHVTMEASAGLVDRGFAIVSGGAYGIDGMAHRAALASGGHTIAVLAGGIDRFYPSGHEALLNRIVDAGCVATEVPPGTPPTRWRFLARNRLIAALGQATVVMEAGWRSGALNTANHANDLARPLGAVPGPVTSSASAGCHRIIREGARLVTTPDEMAALVTSDEPGGPAGFDDPDVIRVVDALSARSGRAADDIAARAGMSVADVQAVLGRLELDGVVREASRGWVRDASVRRSQAGAPV